MKTLTMMSALLLGASPALAGNLTPAPAPVRANGDWTGGYIGAQLGYGSVDSNSSAIGDGDGVIGGVHAGYDYDFGQFVLGGALEYDAADIDLSTGNSIDDVARLKVRGGVDLGRTLVYGTAGAARMSANIGGSSGTDNGYFAGIGVDRMVTDRVSVGGELLYSKFDDFNSTGVDLDGPSVSARVAFHF